MVSLIECRLACEEKEGATEMDSSSVIELGSPTPPILVTNGRNVYTSMRETPRAFLGGVLSSESILAYIGLCPDQTHSPFLRALLLHQQIGI